MAQNRTWTITQSDVSRTFTISPGVGPVGPAGPNNITTSTETDITGILKGDGANVSAAVEDTDYQGVPAEGAFADGDKTKLDGIEAGADVTDATNVNAAGAVMESDYSPSHSVLAQQSGTGSPSAVTLGTNAILGRTTGAGTSITGLSASDVRTMLNVEDGATADQTGAEIKSLYEAEADTNAFTDAEKSKLAGIEAGADVTDAANVDAAGAVMETDLQSDIEANPSAPLKGDGAGGINVSYLGLETYILGGPVAPSGTPSWNMPNVGGVLANATNNDGEVGANGIDFAGSTEIGADLADADEILVSDGGGNTTRRKSLVSRIWTYIKAKIESVGLASLDITGDLTVDTNTLHVDSANNRVGIGTASPSHPAHFVGSSTSTEYISLFVADGTTPEAGALSTLSSKGIGVQSNGAAYYFGRDPLNNIEFVMGTSSSGVVFGGSLTNHPYEIRTWNQLRAKVDASEFTLYQPLGFSANSGTWNGATITGAQTFSGQVELTGQAASTDDSAMTRSLIDEWEISKLGQQYQLSIASPATGTSGAGSAVATDVGRIRVTSGTATSGYARATLLYTPHGFASGAYYNRAIKAAVNIYFNQSSAATTSSGFRFWFGASTPPAFDANALASAGFGVEYAPDGTNHRIRAFAHNGTTYTSGSWVNFDTGNILIKGSRSLSIESDGSGNVTAIISGSFGDTSTVYTATTTGAPTSYNGATANLNISASNASTGTPTSTLYEIRSAIVRFE